MSEFTPIHQALTVGEKYEILFEMNGDGTRIKFHGLNNVHQVTMREMAYYELYQNVNGFDHLNIRSRDGSMDYFFRVNWSAKWKYVKNSTVEEDNKCYTDQCSALKRGLNHEIDAFVPDPCRSPEENYLIMLESLRERFYSGAWNPDRITSHPRLLN